MFQQAKGFRLLNFDVAPGPRSPSPARGSLHKSTCARRYGPPARPASDRPAEGTVDLGEGTSVQISQSRLMQIKLSTRPQAPRLGHVARNLALCLLTRLARAGFRCNRVRARSLVVT